VRVSVSSHLQLLEGEAIYVLREVAAQFERPVLLFSGGKDSVVVAWLARKAFAPARNPFPLLHIDTGHNFPETLRFRDEFVARMESTLLVRLVQDSIDAGRVREETGPATSRNALQTVTLLHAIKELGFDAAIGGARRDEEKARAKERVFSHRDALGQWDPKNQRPELWNLYNGRKNAGEHFRVFPLSNWTELDVWQYLASENVPLPSLYFAHRRPVFERAGMLLAATPFVELLPGEVASERTVRFRTVGDATCTAAFESDAATPADIVGELAVARVTERAGRIDDQRSDTAMEDRKRQGYF
jgi:sulfate adenylyltransferase subunit 2